ncbi:DUF4163 domain-containing protein [Clostridium sp. SHJSY1]|uniref:hypothetical protein n=1 Tax=Clostridium sp. SHJSY1 TaxID=2942483 RepID=UPI0028744379|nr:hypothetical protein [Clostridium sp. SHJSY1]MDS0527618.1 DUF4163 domain-containing protein [Clostridium sp. SHJSY1]
MNRKILITMLISVGIFMVGCSNKQASNDTNSQERTKTEAQQSVDDSTTKDKTTNETKSTNTSKEKLETTKEMYKNKKVTIYYPQIKGLSDSNKQSNINKMIKDGALSYVSKGVEDNLTLDINYKITLLNSKAVSIQYSGVANFASSMHPDNVFYTTNIDLNNEKIMKLSDLVKVDKNLVNSFRKGKFIPYVHTEDAKTEEEYRANINNIVSTTMDDNSLLSDFQKSDVKEEMMNIPTTSCYLTEDSIGISINVPHAVGDHVEFEMKYADIKNNKNANNKIWE